MKEIGDIPYKGALQVITKSIAAIPEVEAVILFGSRARHDNAPRADIDLAVSYPGRDSFVWSKIDDIIQEAPTLLPIDFVHLEEAGRELKENILRDGKVLFQREKNG